MKKGEKKSGRGYDVQVTRAATCVQYGMYTLVSRASACMHTYVHARGRRVHGPHTWIGTQGWQRVHAHTNTRQALSVSREHALAPARICVSLRATPSSEIWIFQLVEHTEQNVTLRYVRGGKGLRE